MRFAQDGRNWFFSSREDDENVESLQTDGHTHRLLDGRKDIGPATGDQNTYKKLKWQCKPFFLILCSNH